MKTDKRREELNQWLTDIATKNNQVQAIFDAADKASRSETDDEIKQVKSLNKEIEELQEKAGSLKEILGLRDETKARNDDLTKTNRPPFSGADPDAQTRMNPFKSLSDIVLEDENFKGWREQNQQGFKSGAQRTINSPQVQVKSLLRRRYSESQIMEYLKAVITGAGSTTGGPFVFPDFKPIVDESYRRPLNIRDLITIGETSSDTVEYVRITGVTNAAAPTAEATATGDGSGAKPESALATLRVSETVKTIAHWIPVTTRALADAGQLRTYIDAFLRYGVEEELEDQILTGSGSGENFSGVLTVSGTTAQAFTTDIVTTTRKARTKVRVTGRAMPTAWVMHPNDWEQFDLLKDNEGRFYWGGPRTEGEPRLWGLPVIESEGMTEGTAVVADWKLAVLWDRMETAISMSNSHSDFFVRNLVAILAEMRAAFGLLRPKAFVLADLTA